MNRDILTSEAQLFIQNNLKADINKLIFKGSPFDTISIQELVNQIMAKQKAEKKLPTWFQTNLIYYPSKLSIEQTSSERTAKYKATLIKGNSLIDLTGGFGVDTFYFSKAFTSVTHCEINSELSTIVNYNYSLLKTTNINTIAIDGIEYLKNVEKQFDCIYIDPSRRSDIKGKVFLLKDCLPNVPEHLDFLFSKSSTILIKNSPILDISSAISELKHVKEIHIISLKNEVKELLFLLEKEYVDGIEIKTHNILDTTVDIFSFEKDSNPTITYSLPQHYLYEPNAAILKSGGFAHISEQLKIAKLHQHSHLYTSEELIANFPGRLFLIEKVFKYNKKLIKKEITEKQANITTRNFPKSVEQLRKETKLKDGGTTYLFFSTDLNNDLIAIKCKKINSQ
ncbi:THUMP-like domain-containing protein [Tenacibaculum sp. TC6]|uniref:THUMP-like domain-containing protein n=1 Tax=Tenacibaculum sp. TC6 TaxID=3423223 RepID=UPI003D35DBDA